MHTFTDREGGIWDDDDFDPEGTVACHDCGLSHRDCRENGGCACEVQAAWDAAEAEREEWEKSRSVCAAVEAAGKSYAEAALDLIGEDDSVSVDRFIAIAKFLGWTDAKWDRLRGRVELGERAA